MFYPVRMKRVHIITHHDYEPVLLRSLQESGILEISDVREKPDLNSLLNLLDPVQCHIERIVHLQMEIDRLIDILDDLSPKPGSLFSLFRREPDPVRMAAHTGADEPLLSKAEDLVTSGFPLIELAEEKKKIQDQIEEGRETCSILRYLEPFRINLHYLVHSRFCSFFFGLISDHDPAGIEYSFESSGIIGWTLDFAVSGNKTVLLVAVLNPDIDRAREILRAAGVHLLTIPDLEGFPGECIAEKTRHIGEFQSRLTWIDEQINEMHKSLLVPFRAVSEELGNLRKRHEIGRRLGITRSTVVISGWCRERDIPHLEKTCTDLTAGVVSVLSQPPCQDESVPVEYDNPPWLRPFEFLTTMFSRPRYTEVDPTPFLAPAFLLFFGLMLGDAAYGIIITIIAILLYRGAGSRSREVRDMSYVLAGCGIVDVICGTLQGGWFGDLLPRVFGFSPPFVLIEPLETPIAFFLLSLVIGTLHINLGICIAFYQHIRKREVRQALQEEAVWFLIQLAAAVLIAGFFNWAVFPGVVRALAGIGLLIGIGIIFWNKGPMGFFSLTGFLGDWLSYVRILALALATGGIAMTINILAGMVASIHPWMLIPAVLVFIGGQTFNLAIQTLGSVIHAIRLHYIEFFGRFYSGGGRAFIPFCADRIVTYVGDER